MNSLTRKVIVGFIQRIIFVVVSLFVPAGSLSFPRAWIYLAVYFLPYAWMIQYFLRTNPRFIERRAKIGPGAETRPRQKLIMRMVLLCSCISIMTAGFDHRFVWSHVPMGLSIAAYVLILIAMGIQFRVFLENSFASATIEIATDQKVITTGPYALVRHPMYFGALLMDCAVPLALGSWWALLPVAVKVPVIVLRLHDEEEMLQKQLVGYAEYCDNVRRRLVPGIW